MLPPEFERELEARKLESLAEFAAGAGHEINNPLATIAGRVQLLLRDETDPERRRALETIGGQAYRIRDMIGDVMLFARPPAPEPVPLDLAAVTQSQIERLRTGLESAGGKITCDAAEPVPVFADENQLRIVIDSLLRNAVEAAEGSPDVRAGCRRLIEDGVAQAELTIADEGIGLSELDRAHLFDPFYSGRQAGRGLGFGLSKCWRIVSNHGGRIDVESVPGGTTTFRVVWPAPTDEDPRDVA